MVLVEAGGCTVTTKVRNIEKAGGQIAVIGDGFYDSIEDVYMEDVDGSGFSLTIPALLIGKADARTLKVALQSKLQVKMKVDLEISHSDSKFVEVGLWYGSALDLDPKFLQGLYDYQHVLQNNVKFTPHIITL
jgi:hypothetical protein